MCRQRKIYTIVGHEADRVRAAVASTGVGFILQPEQQGTGHALQMVKAHFAVTGEDLPENLLVLSGDVPLIRAETIEAICRMHREERAAMTILTAVPEDPTGYGRVVRKAAGGPEVNGDRRAEGADRRTAECTRDQFGNLLFRDGQVVCAAGRALDQQCAW